MLSCRYLSCAFHAHQDFFCCESRSLRWARVLRQDFLTLLHIFFLWLGWTNLLSGNSTKSVQALKRPSAWRRSKSGAEGRQSRLPPFPCISHAGSFAVVYKGLDVEAWVVFFGNNLLVLENVVFDKCSISGAQFFGDVSFFRHWRMWQWSITKRRFGHPDPGKEKRCFQHAFCELQDDAALASFKKSLLGWEFCCQLHTAGWNKQPKP